jgi:hypothetical protein
VLRDFNLPDSQLEFDGGWLLKERPGKCTGIEEGHSVPVDVLRQIRMGVRILKEIGQVS